MNMRVGKTVSPSTLDTALAFHAAGVCVIPPAVDGTKAPHPGEAKWTRYKSARPTEAQLRSWLANDHPGVGIVGGAVSGGLVCLDVEGRAVHEGVFDRYTGLAEDSGLGEVLRQVMDGYTETTASGGLHLLWRVDDGQGVPNAKLARRPSTDEELAENPQQKMQVLVEVKSEGGFLIVAPSGGPVHPNGGDWTLKAGGPTSITTISREYSDALLELARMLDETPKPEAPPPRAAATPRRNDGGLTPGDDYEQRTDWADILTPHGWTCTSQHGRTRYWQRPEKRIGISATTGHDPARDRLYVFTTSTEFDSEVPYTKFGAYALLEHGGDHSAAARALAAAGYGTQRRRKLQAVPDPQGAAPTETDGSTALQPGPEEDLQEPAGEEGPPVGFNYHRVFGLPEGTTTPKHYRVNGGGVALQRVVGKEKEETWVRFTFAPLVITATFEDPEGEQFVELSWTDRSKGPSRVISRIVSRETAKRGKELIKQLGGAGLPAVEGDARLVERWLAEFEAANRDNIPSEQLARWLGWQPDGSFVSSPDEGVKVDVAYDEQRAPARAHTRKGTLAAWRDTVRELESYPVPRIAIAAAFAAPLLRPLGVSSFTLDISSRSTKGKTTALQCALSVWANPSEASDAMSNWRSTLYAIEKRLNLVRGIITVFDETMAVTDESIIDEVLYQVPMSHGKARSGGAFGSMLPWETILLSSGERPALSFTTSQGAAARILGTTVAPFGDNGGPAAVKARDGVLANFGHAGPDFVAAIRKGLDKTGGVERLRDQHRELVEKYRGENDLTSRRAPMVAALALAEIIAHRIGLLPYEPLPEEQWRRMFATHNPTDDRPEMAMDVLREYVAGHTWELYPGLPGDTRPPYAGWLGVEYKDPDGTPYVALMPQRVRKILDDAGYQFDAVIDAWADAGYLKLMLSQRPAYLIPKRFAGARAKLLHFTKPAIDVTGSGEGA